MSLSSYSKFCVLFSLSISDRRASFIISCKGDLVIALMNSLSLCLSWKVFISLSKWRMEYTWLVMFFSLNSSDVSFHLIWTCRVFAEKPFDNLMGLPFVDYNFFSMAAFRILFIFEFWQFYINVLEKIFLHWGN